MKQLKIGDIIEIKTRRGLVYAQFTHRHKAYGSLIRILPNYFENRPDDLSELVSGKTKFVTFYPVGVAVTRGLVSVVGNAPIPGFATAFPLFRDGTPNPSTGKVDIWWLWDGKKEWQIGELTNDQKKLPLARVWNHTLLVERLESGWMPEDQE